MADNNEEINEGSGQEAAQPQKEFSDVEQRAMAQGWVPEDQYSGSGKWRSAEDFLDRGELFAKIDEQNRRIKGMESTLHAAKTHLELVRKTEYNRAVQALRAEKKQALAEGDADAVVDVEERMEVAKAEFVQEQMAAQRQQQLASQQPHPVLTAWVNKNTWYQTDRAMRVFADEVGKELAAAGLADPRELLDEVERRTKKEFSHKFQNPNRAKPGSVESGTNKGSQSKDTFQLTPEETVVMNKFVKAGHMSKEEYIKDIKAQRGA